MKKMPAKTSLLLLLVMLLGFVMVSCKGDDPQPNQGVSDLDEEDYYEFQTIDLSEYGIDAFISLPDETANIGASTTPGILHPEDHLWQLDVGQNFTMHIEDMAHTQDNVKREKKDLARKKFFEVKYIIDEPDLIMYERKLIVSGLDGASSQVGVEHKSYHVYGQRKINGITYVLESREEGYEKIIIELMSKSIKSFKSKTAS